MFVLHKFFAFPVVDEKRVVRGMIDIGVFSEEVLDFSREPVDNLFEALGFRLSQLRDASPWKAFRYRFPWLLATIASGTAALCSPALLKQHSPAPSSWPSSSHSCSLSPKPSAFNP
jgi:Mg/Co/Ni transporter MgtE